MFKFYGNFDCLAFKNQVPFFEKSIFLSCCEVKFYKLLLSTLYYNTIETNVEDLELHYMDCE